MKRASLPAQRVQSSIGWVAATTDHNRSHTNAAAGNAWRHLETPGNRLKVSRLGWDRRSEFSAAAQCFQAVWRKFKENDICSSERNTGSDKVCTRQWGCSIASFPPVHSSQNNYYFLNDQMLLSLLEVEFHHSVQPRAQAGSQSEAVLFPCAFQTLAPGLVVFFLHKWKNVLHSDKAWETYWSNSDAVLLTMTTNRTSSLCGTLVSINTYPPYSTTGFMAFSDGLCRYILRKDGHYSHVSLACFSVAYLSPYDGWGGVLFFLLQVVVFNLLKLTHLQHSIKRTVFYMCWLIFYRNSALKPVSFPGVCCVYWRPTDLQTAGKMRLILFKFNLWNLEHIKKIDSPSPLIL